VSEYLAGLALQNSSQSNPGSFAPGSGATASNAEAVSGTPEAEANAVAEMLMNFEVEQQPETSPVTRAGDLLMWILNLELRLPPYGDLTQA